MAQILIVDDDDAIRGLFRRILEGDGHTISEASNGEIALSRFADCWADLVITDIVMPEKDGLELLTELRRQVSGVKIVAISGGGGLNPFTYLAMARERGADAVLFKPVAVELLLKTVRQLLAKDTAQDRVSPRGKTL